MIQDLPVISFLKMKNIFSVNQLPQNEACEQFKLGEEKKKRAQEISSESEAESEPDEPHEISEDSDNYEETRYFLFF